MIAKITRAKPMKRCLSTWIAVSSIIMAGHFFAIDEAQAGLAKRHRAQSRPTDRPPGQTRLKYNNDAGTQHLRGLY